MQALLVDIANSGKSSQPNRGLCVRFGTLGPPPIVSIVVLALSLVGSLAHAAEEQGTGRSNHRHFIGTSASVLMGFLPDPPIRYFQLDYGYRFTDSDAVIVELIAMGYSSPMGNPGLSGLSYPGSIWAQGLSLAYQRFVWKRLFVTIHATPQLATYSDSNDDLLQRGFLLWFQARVGYQVDFKDPHFPFFLEPSIEVNYWPLNWNVPQSFSDVDTKYPNFLVAPGLNLGVRF